MERASPRTHPRTFSLLCCLPSSPRSGAVKPRNSLLRELVLGVLAGAFIGFGFTTCMLAAGLVSRPCLMRPGATLWQRRRVSRGRPRPAEIAVPRHRQMTKEQREEYPWLFNVLFGAYGFPVGLCMCVINGASLFTSNIAYMATAVIQRKAAAHQALRVLVMSYFANLAGAPRAMRCVPPAVCHPLRAPPPADARPWVHARTALRPHARHRGAQALCCWCS